ncbi:MAG TPA: transposase, partial [Pseudonocardiaceae bacterium]|nr:transposase [Pseudonocardiaceae bacterium]
MRRNGARRVLRGRRRSNAPPLPDWKPVFYLLEAQGLDPWLVNAKDVQHLPGRPKTDKLDAVWLCKVAERQMVRPSFVPPPEIRRLRDVTRYRI